MLYLKIEEGDVVAAWYQVLGPPDLEKAQQEEPDSLVAQFGEEEFVVPAWLPRSRELQLRLAARFFPPPPDATVPRLLLLPDADHQEVLERMGVSGVQVLAHTQLTLQQEAIQSLPSLSASPLLASAAGSSVLAVVVAGEGTEECVQEFGPLHLSSDTASANAEVELFFPDFLAAQESQDEPQTQMQIEQRKEAK
ncbi:thioredoxin domain-containing protein 6-like [Penaeus chinensis]|uniref:thioredoxin domain-containing protein 6-like n=1 Tax=Penaeus chinensis TaxID=139456 RepID=UPI001FB7C84C|nr:thioredoxin domain-containing protein 6-like [Penaeus chinensis]